MIKRFCDYCDGEVEPDSPADDSQPEFTVEMEQDARNHMRPYERGHNRFGIRIIRTINDVGNGGFICGKCLGKALLEAAIQCDPEILFWKPQQPTPNPEWTGSRVCLCTHLINAHSDGVDECLQCPCTSYKATSPCDDPITDPQPTDEEQAALRAQQILHDYLDGREDVPLTPEEMAYADTYAEDMAALLVKQLRQQYPGATEADFVREDDPSIKRHRHEADPCTCGHPYGQHRPSQGPLWLPTCQHCQCKGFRDAEFVKVPLPEEIRIKLAKIKPDDSPMLIWDGHGYTPKIEPLETGTLKEASLRFTCPTCKQGPKQECIVTKPTKYASSAGLVTAPHKKRYALGRDLIVRYHGQQKTLTEHGEAAPVYEPKRLFPGWHYADPDEGVEIPEADLEFAKIMGGLAEASARVEQWLQEECTQCHHTRRQHQLAHQPDPFKCNDCNCDHFTDFINPNLQPKADVPEPQSERCYCTHQKREHIDGVGKCNVRDGLIGECKCTMFTPTEEVPPYVRPAPQWDVTAVQAASDALVDMQRGIGLLQRLLGPPSAPEPETLWDHLDYLPRHRQQMPLGYEETEL